MSSRSPLLPLVRKFFESDPASAVHVLETVAEKEAVQVLKALPSTITLSIFSRLQAATAAGLLMEAPPELYRDIVSRIEAQQAAILLLSLPEEHRSTLLDNMNERTRRTVQELLTYPENSAGRHMSTEFIVFHEETKVKEAVQKLRLLHRSKAPVSYVYVLDHTDQLVDVMYMRDMLVAHPEERLGALMRTELFTVNAFDDREEVLSQLSKHKFFAAPVVDSEHHLLGVVKSDRLLENVQSDVTQDFLKMFGAGGDEQAFSPVSYSLRKRLPWLYINLATAFLAASVVSLFEDIIAKVTILAVFLPVVAGQGGNTGAQSLAVVMRGLVMREVTPKTYKKMVIKESLVGAANGILIGLVTALIAWLWHGNPYLGVVIGLAMIVNLLAAGFSGAIIPLAMKALGFDPAQSSSIILTTVTDIVGFFAFLGFAVLFQNRLM
jgi:magnesium transporter